MADLTPTETLILEVLIARTRLGETLWTFDDNASSARALGRLEARGLVHGMHGITERTFRASLTDTAKRQYMSRPYRAPMLEPLRALIDGTEWLPTSWRDTANELSRTLARLSQGSSAVEPKA